MESLQLLLQHSDKGLSAILLIFFIVKLLPQINKLVNTVEDLKDVSARRERQSDDTQKDLIKLIEQVKAKKG